MRLPQPFGKYLLLERISVGGMAEVFKAKAFGVEGFEKIIAIKKILPSMAEDADFIQMFIDEAKICGQLNHANICQIFELGRIDDSHFIAMEYIWGKDLLQIQNRFRRSRKQMTVQMAAFIASKMCEGLDYAHRKKDATGKPLNIIHRDVSPQNVIVSYEGEVKVIDFGIAKAASRSSKTQAGVLKGKFGYMSPEQVGGKQLDQRADIFAIGTILYELLTSERLFLGDTDFATLEKVRNVAVPPPSKVNTTVPAELDRIIMKALAKETGDRYQWASEMHEDLQDFLAQTEPVYNAKALSGWMRDQFSVEMRKEAAVLDEQRKIGKEAMAAGPGTGKSTAPPSSRLKSPTLAPGSSPGLFGTPASSSASLKVPSPADEAGDGGTLLEDAAEEISPDETEGEGEGGLLNEKTSIVMPDHPQPGDMPAQSTQILGGAPDGAPGDLPGVATMVFNPDQQAPPAPAPAPPPPQPLAPPVIAPQLLQPNQSMVAPMGAFPTPYGSAVMPAMQMPYHGTGAFPAMGTGHTGMMMLPNGAIVQAMLPGPPPQNPAVAQKNALIKDILVGVLVAVGVIALVLVLKFALSPGKGTIVLNVIPPRVATVYVDGREYGRVEPNVALPIENVVQGSHQITVRAEDGEAQQVVEVTAGKMHSVAIQLIAASAGGGTGIATSTGTGGSGTIKLRLPPDGALVSIDGRLVSDREIQKGYLVSAGTPHEVKVSKAGKREEKFTVNVQPGQEFERDIELKEGKGRLVVATRPPGADVLLNGRPYGKTPTTIEDLDPTKPYKVTVKKKGFSALNKTISFGDSFDQTVDLDLEGGAGGGGGGDKPAAGGPAPAPAPGSSAPAAAQNGGGGAAAGGDGFLVANSHPFAQVWVDGRDTGKVTPIVSRDRIPLKAGKHIVTFVTSGKKFSYDVQIRGGEEFKLVRDLNDN